MSVEYAFHLLKAQEEVVHRAAGRNDDLISDVCSNKKSLGILL